MKKLVAAGALTAALSLSSCSDDPEVIEPEPTVDTSTSSPGTPLPTSPPLPSRASSASSTGAATFVRYWIDLFNYAARTGKTRDLRRFSDGCEPCTAYANDFEQLPSWQRPKTVPWTVTGMKVGRKGDNFVVAADVRVLGETEERTLSFQVRRKDPFVVRDVKEAR